MNTFMNILTFVLAINTLLAILTVFKEKREISATWAWLLVLILLPGLGFIVYLFLGRKISKDQIFDLKTQKLIDIDRIVDRQKKSLDRQSLKLPEKLDTDESFELIQMLLNMAESPISTDNEVDIFVDGREKFDQLIKDLEQAQDHIHMMYYIFRDDGIGTRIIEVLERKAAEGVEVCLMFDSLGSRGVKDSSFDRLRANGGQLMRSFENSFFLLNTNINFRNHRKIVNIDNKIAYVGGFNVGDDYLGLYEDMGYWRDTHLRIQGQAVLALQARFIMDWNASAKNEEERLIPKDTHFKDHHASGHSLVQIVSSGPDSETQENKKGFMKMVSQASESILIQTPYLIPDDAFMETLKISIAAGIDVKIMIPNKPDHPFIYQATLYYARELAEAGAEIYIYDKGFIHAKTMVIDQALSTVGTSNFDIRSFKLNFEINAYLYDEDLSKQLAQAFFEDMEDSYILDEERMAQFSQWQLFKQSFSRLLSPIL